jgi:transposase InsO family protein
MIMPWKERSLMSLRQEFVAFALNVTRSISLQALCQRFKISPKTGYKWITRYRGNGVKGLEDRSRRPHHSPFKTAEAMEGTVLRVRDRHSAWGGRKIRKSLIQEGLERVPAASTITEILRRHDRLNPEETSKHKPWQRFVKEAPNRLWQMDFKGHFELQSGGRCHPLTLLDDHSRFALGLRACGDEQEATVQGELTGIFRDYGLPEAMIMDNGAPWGHYLEAFTRLNVWLIRLGIHVGHSRPGHPQTHGKNERFNRTLKVELLQHEVFHDLQHSQEAFDRWRDVYNLERPHEALEMKTPAECYQPSSRFFPEVLAPIEYGPGDIVRKVQSKGEIHYRGHILVVGHAFHGYPVALRPTTEDGVLDVYFCQQKISKINLKETK